jgi:hypothetical protein
MTERRAPAALRARGKRFWTAVTGRWELSLVEIELLVEVCRHLDECEALQLAIRRDGATTKGSNGQVRAHPALAELRGARVVLGRLLAQLRLPDDLGDELPSPRTARARRAAQVRWLHHERGARRGQAS